jgi:16S rRNA (guanine966-N2)-methyltransferase
MFSVVEHHMSLQGAVVLDLFAGSGQLSWEALSRGAASSTLIDASTEVCRHLRAVAIELGLSQQVTIIRSDVLQYLRHGDLHPANLVVLDPPYHLRCCNAVVHELVRRPLLAPDALVVVEHGDQEALLPVDNCAVVWHRERSTTVVDILVHQVSQP